MTDRDAFLRAIREQPHDHLRKLVFADWLEERGEADEAATIRQPFAAILPGDTRTPAYRRWLERAKAQLAGIVPQSVPMFLHLIPDPVVQTGASGTFPAILGGYMGNEVYAAFRHGFVAAVGGTPRQISRIIGNGLFAKLPICWVAVGRLRLAPEWSERPGDGRGGLSDRRVCVRRSGGLPVQVYHLLTSDEFTTRDGDVAKGYRSASAAYDDISRAYVAFGREAAGLSAIQEPELEAT